MYYFIAFAIVWLMSVIIPKIISSKGKLWMGFLFYLLILPVCLILAWSIPNAMYKETPDRIMLSREKIVDETGLYEKPILNREQDANYLTQAIMGTRDLIRGNEVNIHAEPIATLKAGEEVEIFGINRALTRYKVKAADGTIGWIKTQALPPDVRVKKYTVFSSFFLPKVQYPDAYERQLAELVPGKRVTVMTDTSIFTEDENGDLTVEAKVLKKGETLTITGELVHRHFMAFPVQAGDVRGFVSERSILAYEVKP
jgi:hypothetical protein